MFGPSSHTIVRGNTCEGNHGAGIAAIGDFESKGTNWNAFHWIIENQGGEPVGSISTHDCNPRYGTFSYGIDIASEHQRKDMPGMPFGWC